MKSVTDGIDGIAEKGGTEAPYIRTSMLSSQLKWLQNRIQTLGCSVNMAHPTPYGGPAINGVE